MTQMPPSAQNPPFTPAENVVSRRSSDNGTFGHRVKDVFFVVTASGDKRRRSLESFSGIASESVPISKVMNDIRADVSRMNLNITPSSAQIQGVESGPLPALTPQTPTKKAASIPPARPAKREAQTPERKTPPKKRKGKVVPDAASSVALFSSAVLSSVSVPAQIFFVRNPTEGQQMLRNSLISQSNDTIEFPFPGEEMPITLRCVVADIDIDGDVAEYRRLEGAHQLYGERIFFGENVFQVTQDNVSLFRLDCKQLAKLHDNINLDPHRKLTALVKKITIIAGDKVTTCKAASSMVEVAKEQFPSAEIQYSVKVPAELSKSKQEPKTKSKQEPKTKSKAKPKKQVLTLDPVALFRQHGVE